MEERPRGGDGDHQLAQISVRRVDASLDALNERSSSETGSRCSVNRANCQVTNASTVQRVDSRSTGVPLDASSDPVGRLALTGGTCLGAALSSEIVVALEAVADRARELVTSRSRRPVAPVSHHRVTLNDAARTSEEPRGWQFGPRKTRHDERRRNVAEPVRRTAQALRARCCISESVVTRTIRSRGPPHSRTRARDVTTASSWAGP